MARRMYLGCVQLVRYAQGSVRHEARALVTLGEDAEGAQEEILQHVRRELPDWQVAEVRTTVVDPKMVVAAAFDVGEDV